MRIRDWSSDVCSSDLGKPGYALPRRSPPCPRGHGGRPGHPLKENLRMSLINEFKAFAVRGNVVDMAVGIVIGAAFGKIVSSFVDGVIMPRSEERRVGKAFVRTCRSRWSPYN